MAKLGDNVLLQDEKTGVIPTETADIILKQWASQSIISQLAQHEPMTKPEKVFTYLAGGPGAYWVGEGEKIQTAKAQWLQATMKSKKLGVIIPVSKEMLKYSVSNVFEQLKPAIAEEFAKKIDEAALFGTNSPFGAGQSLFERAVAAKQTVPRTTDLYDDLNNTIALVEEADKEPNGLLATRSLKKDLRGARDENKMPIFNEPGNGATNTALGLPIGYASTKSFDRTKAVAFTGAWSYARYGVLDGIEYSISEDAQLSTITNEDGTPVNLFEQDLVALKVTMQIGFCTLSEDAFAALVPATATPASK